MENLSQLPDGAPFPNPLIERHRTAGGDALETLPFGAIEIVSTFGQPQLEYAALHKGAGLVDRPHRGVLELTGRDRLSFLNGLISNDTWDKQSKRPMPDGTTVYAFLLNLKGRVVCDLNVIALADRTLLEMDVRMVEPVRQVLDQYLFAEQVKMRSLVGDVHVLSLYGPRSAEALASPGDAAGNRAIPLSISGVEVIAAADDVTGSSGFTLLISIESVRDVYEFLASSPAVRPVGWAAFNTARVEAGRPLFGIDFEGVPPQTAYPSKKAQQEAESGDAGGPGILPAETGVLFARAVSLTKCYIGQEVVARMHARKVHARQIVGVRMVDDALPIAGAPVNDAAGNQIGIVTSSTLSPIRGNAALCLAFVKRPHFATGTSVHVAAEGAMRPGTVVDLPFAR